MNDTADPSAVPPVPIARRRKLPMAVSIVSILVAATACVNLAFAAIVPILLWRENDLAIAPMIHSPFTNVAMVAGSFRIAVQPFDLAYGLAVGVVELVLLFGFRRLRRWGWVGLMTSSGLFLAVALVHYMVSYSHHTRDFVTMAVQSIVVLSLNAQVVQEAFGLRKAAPTTVPVRNTQAPQQAGRV